MKDIQFSSANVRIRTYENQLLDHPFLERLLSVDHARDLFPILQETPYGDFIEETTNYHDFEQILLAEEKRTFEQAYALTPIKEVVDVFTLKYDYQNLKVLVKMWYTKEDLAHLLVPFGSVSLTHLKEGVQTRKHQALPQAMIDCLEEVFSYIEEYEEVQGIDIIFDNYYWQHFLEITKRHNGEIFGELGQRMIDVFNISTILRSYITGRKKGFMSAVVADGGTLSTEPMLSAIQHSLSDFMALLAKTPYHHLVSSSIQEFEEFKTLNQFDLMKDNFLMASFKERKVMPFGPSAMLGYLYAKESEIKNLRLIFIGKINKIPVEILRSRVRETYV